MNIGKIGIWAFLDMLPAAQARAAAAEIEALGYGALWIPEAIGREVFSSAAILLGASPRLVIATGIANIWARDAMAMAAAQKTLCEAYPQRFLLGMGVSHAPLVGPVRGHHYQRPLSTMREYLDAMDAAPFMAVAPPSPPERVLAALHPKMLALAAERADGSHTYFVPPEHTRRARAALGSGKRLAAEQAVVLETDAEKARALARTHMATYLNLPNYARNLRSLGFSDEDLGGGGSDRLVDSIVAWGAVEAIAARVRQHHDAGADHVCLQVLDPDPSSPPLRQWRELARALL